MPIWEVFLDKEITLPFCLAWANHSWEKNNGDRLKKAAERVRTKPVQYQQIIVKSWNEWGEGNHLEPD